jgi:hypothetical protein
MTVSQYKRIIAICSLVFLYSGLSAQSYFKVEFDAFSPPVKDMIDNIEGKHAKNFMMKNLNGDNVTLSQHLGKKVILWFWDNEVQSNKLNDSMELLAQKNPQIVFLSLFNNTKDLLPMGAESKPYIILPNAAFLGDAVYDKELGTPRIYLINEMGIAKMVLPQSYLDNLNVVSAVISNFIQNKIH